MNEEKNMRSERADLMLCKEDVQCMTVNQLRGENVNAYTSAFNLMCGLGKYFSNVPETGSLFV